MIRDPHDRSAGSGFDPDVYNSGQIVILAGIIVVISIAKIISIAPCLTNLTLTSFSLSFLFVFCFSSINFIEPVVRDTNVRWSLVTNYKTTFFL